MKTGKRSTRPTVKAASFPKLFDRLLSRKIPKTRDAIPARKPMTGMISNTAPPTKIQIYQVGRPVSLMMSQVFQNGMKAAHVGSCPDFSKTPISPIELKI
jgi:hypothetical protein